VVGRTVAARWKPGLVGVLVVVLLSLYPLWLLLEWWLTK
jgi:hypothetical protein